MRTCGFKQCFDGKFMIQPQGLLLMCHHINDNTFTLARSPATPYMNRTEERKMKTKRRKSARCTLQNAHSKAYSNQWINKKPHG